MFKRKIKITQIKGGQKTEKMDVVLIEKTVNIYLNKEHLVSIICLPDNIKDLAVGFLFSIGIIESFTEIDTIEIKKKNTYQIYIELKRKIKGTDRSRKIKPMGRVIETASGTTPPWRKVIKNKIGKNKKIKGEFGSKIKAEIIIKALKQLQTDTTLFRETGGCHGAALFDYRGNLLSLKEDVGRHNAIDKVIGSHLQKTRSTNFDDIFLTSTGRLTGDSVLKAVRAGFEIMASVSAAVDSGINLANTFNLTLIGFVRGNRMNIYTYPERIYT
jgi:FdhD protein